MEQVIGNKAFFSGVIEWADMWQKNVRLYYVWSLVNSLVLFSAVLVPFFKSRGLNQFEIQSLQAIFQVMIFVMEVPTGVVGDWLGRKWSLGLSGLLMGIGFNLYANMTGFWMLAVVEVLLAMGVAFKSGSDQALIYDSLKEGDKEDLFGGVLAKARILSLLGLSLGSMVGSWSLNWIDMDALVRLTGIVMLIGWGLSWGFYEPDIKSETEETRWKKIMVNGWRGVINNRSVRWLIIEGALVYGLGYYVIWLYQVRLAGLGVKIAYFGLFHSVLTWLQIGWMGIWGKWRTKIKAEWLMKWMPVIVGLGYGIVAGWNSWVGVVIWFGLSGVLGLTSREMLSVEIQKHVKSEVRATVISFSGMARSLMVALTNPLIGWLVDWNLKMTLVGLGLVGLSGYWVGRKTMKVVVNDK